MKANTTFGMNRNVEGGFANACGVSYHVTRTVRTGPPHYAHGAHDSVNNLNAGTLVGVACSSSQERVEQCWQGGGGRL